MEYWKRAAIVMADIISQAKTLQRDVAEGGFDREVERLPDIGRFDRCADSVLGISSWLKDSLSALPMIPESPKERAFREAEERRKRERAEAEEARRAAAEAERVSALAAREAERQADEAERAPYYGGWRDALSDAAR